MSLEVLSNSPNPALDTEGVSIVINRDKRSLDVYQSGKLLDSIPMGTYDIFRPDHDAAFISANGTEWRKS